MNRRSFLTRSGLALGALIVGDEALEAFARMTHVRKSFPSAGVPVTYTITATSSDVMTVTLQGSRDGRTGWEDIATAVGEGGIYTADIPATADFPHFRFAWTA